MYDSAAVVHSSTSYQLVGVQSSPTISSHACFTVQQWQSPSHQCGILQQKLHWKKRATLRATQKECVISHSHADAEQGPLLVFTQTHTRSKEWALSDINRISSSGLNSAVALFHMKLNRSPIHQVGLAHTHTTHNLSVETKAFLHVCNVFFHQKNMNF